MINLEKSLGRLFEPDLPKTELIELLSAKEFRKIGEGFSAQVFGATDSSVVLKIFPPLNVGSPEELSFIQKNLFFRYTDLLTSKWQRFRAVKWLRQKAKLVIAMSRNSDNLDRSKLSSDLSIKGYEICIRKGLMNDFPTKIIPNCISKLSLNISNRKLLSYLNQPDKIILQKRFQDKDLLINLLRLFAQRSEVIRCKKLIEEAVDYQLYLWRCGVADTDMSFNIFENLIVLPDGRLQVHDANDITDLFPAAIWFVREKEKDIGNIFRIMSNEKYPQLLNRANLSGISETARKLYGLFPKHNRGNLVMLFLNLCRDILSEKVLTENWEKSQKTA